ncbi:MAG TPA: MacB family efflux pump subunit [Gammaproteobacteria bacterium]|nr:MacB family efflux pump subunit [Gammaproteobacteria bacterium]
MNTFDGVMPLLEMTGVSKIYAHGGVEVHALDDVTLSVFPGEFVGIMGQSGSGKSTLMNLIGCLDRPSAGCYRVAGRDVAALDANELAALRRDTFGFVFQRYNLLGTATAAENVEIPAIYAGRPHRERARRARELLASLGLAERAAHKPNEMSGGQQQRVSIARALMNGADVILADEPTGALDSHSGEEVLALLRELHSQGRTILLITHDADVAAHAERIIQISDGRIVEDSGVVHRLPPTAAPARRAAARSNIVADFGEAAKMALRSLNANLFRSALTLLGIMIGVASVVAMLAIGNGSKQDVMRRIESMGTNLLLVRPGAPGTRASGDIATLTPADATAVAALPNIADVSPERRTQATVRYGDIDYSTSVEGAWPGYVTARDWDMASGGFITADDVKSYAPVIVLGQTVARNLFPGGGDPIGHYVLVKNVPFEVIGVLAPKGATAFGSDQDDVAMVPLSTGFMRLFGHQYLNSITVKVANAASIDATENAMTALLKNRHRTDDFQIRNTASILDMAEATQNTMTVLLGAVAAISLLVGGIGVMNIMLVSVTERRREIGIRMATGARTGNILLQFNTEALVVCGIGGLIGVALGVAAALLAGFFGMPAALSAPPAILAFSCAFATGLLFGFLPARQAARLDPVVALASE